MIVLFVDMDSFYASCELLRHPELRGKAFIVGTGDEQNKLRGVVETASYEAKRLGIHSAMPVAFALKIKPDIAYVPSDHNYYDVMSAKVMALLKSFGMRTEVLSVDEAAIDLESMEYDKAGELAKKIKDRIGKELGLQCTIGISSGKVFAKMVCDSAKPDGLKVVRDQEIVAFISGKKVDAIPGVGQKTAERLSEMGIRKIGDIADSNVAQLMGKVGSFGRELFNLANGRDDSVVMETYEVLSIGRERTLPAKTTNMNEISRMLDLLADEVHVELLKQGKVFKTVTVKGKYEDFSEKLKSKSFKDYSDSIELMKSTSHTLIQLIIDKNLQFRKVGVRVSALADKKGQKTL